jgi:hypothetical protein
MVSGLETAKNLSNLAIGILHKRLGKPGFRLARLDRKTTSTDKGRPKSSEEECPDLDLCLTESLVRIG